MALKNYTTEQATEKSIGLVQKCLVAHGATGVMFSYADGRISEVSFVMEMMGRPVSFRLPLKWKEARHVLMNDPNIESRYRNRAQRDDDYCYRVAWRILLDWTAAQMAIVDLGMAKAQEVFLPYAVTKSGTTVYETLAADPSRLLGSGG